MNELEGGQTEGRKVSFGEFSETQEGNNDSLNQGNVIGYPRDSWFSRAGKLGKQYSYGMATRQGTFHPVCVTPASLHPYALG